MSTTVKCIEFKNNSGIHTATILANKGIYFQVRDMAGEEYAVPKKQVQRQWEEEELTAEEEAQELTANHAPTLAAALAQITNPTAPVKVKKASPERDPNLVTLKELCFELNIIPRIARRNLRKLVGHVGTGSRWEWAKDSESLALVRAALVKTPAAEATK